MDQIMEKVYCAHDQYDGIILSGVADLNGQPCYFSRIFNSGLADNWTEIYELTILDETTFRLELESWKYWLSWLDSQKDPHPVHYADLRKTEPMDSLVVKSRFEDAESLNKAEENYQNKLKINTFLNSRIPTHYAKAEFFGDRDGIDTQVKWTLADKPTKR